MFQEQQSGGVSADSSSDLVLVVDENGFIQYANPIAAEVVGYEPGELQTRSLFTLMRARDAQNVSNVLRNEIGDSGASFECRMRGKDGSWKVFDVRVQLVDTEQGSRQVRMGCRDITDHAHTARKLRIHEQHPDRYLRLGKQAAGVAYDLLHVLTPLKAVARQLGFSLARTDPRQESFEQLIGAARFAAQLAEQSLALAQGRTPERQPLNLAVAIHEWLPLLQTAVAPGADLRVALDSRTPEIYANPVDMQRMLLNLVLNASATLRSPGGAIEIGVTEMSPRGSRRAAYSSRPREPHNFVRVTVADNGAGMNPDEIAHLLESSDTTGKREPAVSIGLSIVEEIVQEHGGHIGVESRPGAGSSICIDLPILGDAAR